MRMRMIMIGGVSKTRQRKCNKASRRDLKTGSVGWWDATCGMQRNFGG